MQVHMTCALAAMIMFSADVTFADGLINTNPAGAREYSVGGKWFVESMTLREEDGKRILSVSYGAAAKECAGQGPHDGPWLDIIVLNAQGNVLRQVQHIKELMVVDAKTVNTEDIDISDKLPAAFMQDAAVIKSSMKSDGHC